MKKPVSFLFAVLSGAALLSSLAATAGTTYYWCGSAESNVLDKANWYLDSDKKEAASAIPGAGDTIGACKGEEEKIAFTDDTIHLLSQVTAVQPRNGETIINVSTNVDILASIFQWGSSTVVKRGKGAVYLKATGSGNEKSSYREKWRIEEGEVYCPTNLFSDLTYFVGDIDVWEGTRFWIYPGQSTTYVGSIIGKGTVAKERTSGKTGRLQVTSGSIAKPFEGYLTGNFRLAPGSFYLTGVTNDFPCGLYYCGGTVGFRKYSGATGSSLGAGTSRSQTYANDITLLCLATEEDGPQTTSSCAIWDWRSPSQGVGRFVHDAGAYGGVTYAPGTEWDSVFSGYKELVLTGSNTVDCVMRASMLAKNSCSGRYYLTKRGTGTWNLGYKYANMISHETREIIGGIGVENGTLKFESAYEKGSNCSIGTGTAPWFGYAYKGSAALAPEEVDFAIRLGSTNLSENGVFMYAGTKENVLCTTRPIAIVGNGTLANGTDKIFRWSNVKALGTLPEGGEKPAANTLTLADNGANSTQNTLTTLTEETGASPTKVVKTGTGRWTLDGELSFSGGVDVREGTLELANCNYCNWFRVTFTDNYYGFYPETEVPSSVWEKSYIMVGEIGLFDEAGNRVNLNLKLGSNSSTRPTLEEGQTAVCLGSAHSSEKLVNAFDGSGKTGLYLTRNAVVSHTNEASWVAVVMHLPRNAAKVASFDYQYYKGLGNLSSKIGQPKSAIFEGSFDGLNWFTITNATEIADAKATDYWSISGEAFTGSGDVVTGGLPLDTTHAGPTVLTNGLSSVKVAAGATFNILGSPLEIKKLEIDAANGMGTISNASLAEVGTLDLQTETPLENCTIPLSLTSLAGSENISNWNVTVNGAANSRYLFTPSASGIEVRRNGMMFIFR